MAIPIQSPLSYYLREGRQLHKKNTEECLQKLTEKAAVDREENARTVAEYNGYCEAAQDLSKETRSKKRGRKC